MGSLKITLLTGSLEPDRDGVGDYTRHLAAEATRLGLASRIVALADRCVLTPERSDDRGVALLRLPSAMRWPDRFAAARAFLDASPPEWVSLQFVPYSFHRHGIATTIAGAIQNLVGHARLHVMFHEIWIQGTESWRRKLVSSAQRRVVVRLGRGPAALVHTSNETYRRVLRRHGVPAETLPLFGNIRPAPSIANGWLRSLLASEGCDALSTERDRWWLVVLFGTLHPVWPPEPLMAELQSAASALNKRLAIISIGQLGEGERIWERLASTYGERMPMLHLGRRPAHEVSEVLSTADYGIATTPWPLIGKSSTAAAMFDHGLPVIVNREDCVWPGEPARDDRERALTIRCGEGFAERLRLARRLPAVWRLPEIAGRWVAALAAAPPKTS